MILWIIFTIVHGPTSFDRKGSVFGLSTFFWGSVLGGVPNLLIVLGLVGSSGRLVGNTGGLSTIGFILTLLGLLIPAVIDLIAGSLGPPLFLPLVGTGLVLMAVANWSDSQIGKWPKQLLLSLGVVELIAFAWVFLPRNLSDQIYGFRIYGVFAYLLFGTGWMLLGSSMTVER